MKFPRSILVIVSLIVGCQSTAQAQTDVSVQLTAQPTVGLIPGQPIDFTLAVTNHGPLPVDDFKFALFSSDIQNQIASGSVSTDCQRYWVIVSDGKTPYYNLVWSPTFLDLPALEVGETRSCHITLALSDQAPAVWPFGFRISDAFDDTNPGNNVASVILRQGELEPVAVPTLSPITQLMLIIMLASMAWVTIGRSTSRTS